MSIPLEGTLALRRRSPWEAADSGLLLWRENLAYFLPFFALPLWICAFGLRVLPDNMRVWSWMGLWFLKPLFDRPVLHIIAIRFFENPSGAGRLFRGLGKSLLRGLPGDLLWRRLSPLRSAVMPLRVLENLKGKEARKRKRTLAPGGLHFCLLLTIWGLALEVVLLGGEILFALVMSETIREDYISSLSDFLIQSEIFFFAAWCINYMLVESLYVCMGFGLYINSRVEVEGWDIELLFRQFAGARGKKALLQKVLVFFIAAGCLFPAGAYADGKISKEKLRIAGTELPLEALKQVFDSGDFGGERESWGIRLKNQKEGEEPDFYPAPWMEAIKQIFAFALRLVLVFAIVGLGIFLIRYLLKNRRGKIPVPAGGNNAALFYPPGESPESLMEKARAWYDRGEIRRAWGFCLAAALESWSLYRGLEFPPGATEYDCLALARSSPRAGKGPGGLGAAAGEADGAAGENAGETAGFAALVKHWAALAYGEKQPPAGSFEAALNYCGALGSRRRPSPKGQTGNSLFTIHCSLFAAHCPEEARHG
jgi:hypothetical protein